MTARATADLADYARFVQWLPGAAAAGDRRAARLLAANGAHLASLLPIERLTVTDYLDGEGAGSRALMTIWAMAFCRMFALEYVHTPFAGLSHADRPQPEFDAAWERFFNLGEAIVQTLEVVTAVLESRGITPDITVHSEGGRQQFADLERFSPRFDLDGDPMATMQQMIEADLLVSARSCFSYVAALLSDGVVLHEQGRWPAFEDWIVRDAGGSFDSAELAARLPAVSVPRP
ncbi:MAG: hypothetical protein KDE15_04695 [Erythrobacter sp.]|nr:hypothetical protein [Erythrobacter sp.]